MAVITLDNLPAARVLTYETYLTEGEVNARYDILDGVRVFMASPTLEHQDIAGNIYAYFRVHRQSGNAARPIIAPSDVLISRSPLRTRQPDVLLISDTRFGNRDRSIPGALSPAPELVVEILSPSDTLAVQRAKLTDFASVAVLECWMVDANARTVTRLQPSPDGDDTAQNPVTYQEGDTIRSLAFAGLEMPVAAVFAEL